MVNEQQATAALAAWTQAIDAAYAQAMAQAPAPPPEPTFLESVGEGVENLVNGAASLGQAALDNPEAVVAMAGGAALAVGGYALATGGGVVSMSGVGAIAGVPAVWAGAGTAAVGLTGVWAGGQQLLDAASQNPVEPMQVNWGNEKKTAKENEKIQEFQGDSNDAYNANQRGEKVDPPHIFRQKAEETRGGWLFGKKK